MKDIKLRPFTIAHSIWICAVILTLFYIWFAVANRYSIFLYAHLGARPFDAVTRSRYWMAGLVATGLILVVYATLSWILGRLDDRGRLSYQPPKWQQIWTICALPLSVGITAITMTQNWPALPVDLASATTVATLVGLALALPAGAIAAQEPTKLIWLTFYGLALTPILLAFRAIELPDRGLFDQSTALMLSVASLVASLVAVAGLDLLRKHLRKERLSPPGILVAGLGFNYLLLPLVHHLFSTPPDHRYITTAGNFFAFSPLIQLATWGLAIAGISGIDRLIFGSDSEKA